MVFDFPPECCSPSPESAPWVQMELDAATILKISGKVQKIIPVKIEEFGELPATLSSLCWEDFSSQPYSAAFKRVWNSIFDVDVRPPLGRPRMLPKNQRRSEE
jgi:hypothetical protein